MVWGDYVYLHRKAPGSGGEVAAQSSRLVWYFVLFQLFTTVTFPLLYPQNYKVCFLLVLVVWAVWLFGCFVVFEAFSTITFLSLYS